MEKFTRAVRSVVDVVLPNGFAVINAEDPLTAGMGEGCKGQVILFARDGDLPAIDQHRQAGGRVAFLRNDTIILLGPDELAIGPIAEVLGRRLNELPWPWEGLLAAVVAAWALGRSSDTIREGLRSFSARSTPC